MAKKIIILIYVALYFIVLYETSDWNVRYEWNVRYNSLSIVLSQTQARSQCSAAQYVTL